LHDARSPEQRKERRRFVDPLHRQLRLVAVGGEQAEGVADVEILVLGELLLDDRAVPGQVLNRLVGALDPLEPVDVRDRRRIDAGEVSRGAVQLGQALPHARRRRDDRRVRHRLADGRR
jgi:hypothetical protein